MRSKMVPVRFPDDGQRNVLNLWWKKMCFNLSLLQKVETEEQERRSGGNLLHSVGAAKEKERLPRFVRINGTVSRLASKERRLREGLYGVRSSELVYRVYTISISGIYY